MPAGSVRVPVGRVTRRETRFPACVVARGEEFPARSGRALELVGPTSEKPSPFEIWPSERSKKPLASSSELDVCVFPIQSYVMSCFVTLFVGRSIGIAFGTPPRGGENVSPPEA